MIAPATAITGTSALTPMSGSSAMLRKMPVPNPPMPPTTAAPAETAATTASVAGSRSRIEDPLAGHRARAPVTVDRHVGERCFGDLDDPRVFRPSLGVDLHVHRDGRAAQAHQVDVEGEQVAALHRLLEDELLDRDGGDAPARALPRDGAAGDVDLRHDPAAENIAVLVRVGRHGHDAQRGDFP